MYCPPGPVCTSGMVIYLSVVARGGGLTISWGVAELFRPASRPERQTPCRIHRQICSEYVTQTWSILQPGVGAIFGAFYRPWDAQPPSKFSDFPQLIGLFPPEVTATWFHATLLAMSNADAATVISPPRPLGSHLIAEWALDPEIAFLNHGCFGARPKRVMQAQAKLRETYESRPIE